MDFEARIMAYAEKVESGKMQLKQVPPRYRAAVEELLREESK